MSLPIQEVFLYTGKNKKTVRIERECSGGLFCKGCGGCIKRPTFSKYFKETKYTMCHNCEPRVVVKIPEGGACKSIQFNMRHQDIPDVIKQLNQLHARYAAPKPISKGFKVLWNAVDWHPGLAPKQDSLINRWVLVSDGFRLVSVGKYCVSQKTRGYSWDFFPSFVGLGATFCHPECVVDHHVFMHPQEIKYWADIWEGLPTAQGVLTNGVSNDIT